MTNVVKMQQMRLPMKSNGHAIDPKFEEFWKIFPKPVGKNQAYAKWREIVSEGGMDTKVLCRDSGQFLWIHVESDADRIIAGAKRYRKSQIDPQTYKVREYTANPVTWLNNGRWMDDE